jgi:uncharacterized protein
MRRAIGWQKEAQLGGAEWVDVVLRADRLSATGTAIGATPVPYRLDYDLDTGPGFVTRRLRVRSHGNGWRRHLDLCRADDGTWTADGTVAGEPVELSAATFADPGASAVTLASLAGALDCDLGECPLTNTMPVLRRSLLQPSDPIDFVIAWVSVPDLSVRHSDQRYTFLEAGPGGGAVIRYESGSLRADVRFDADGLVVDYPGLGRRLSALDPVTKR